MPVSTKSMIACACAAVAALSTAACSPRHIPSMTVADLMEDRVALDGVLMKCNGNPQKARNDSDCLNARIAIERLAARVDPAVEAKRAEDFERSREQLRVSEEKKRQQEQESKPKVDAYHLPVIPVEPAPPPKDPQSPTVSQTNP
ncbi:MAG TPA: EexN family lipoprotein [Steroidobacteraceae bacterium]|nr:EexN family lipoprotein [Steroidobacteraceae bacterium]